MEKIILSLLLALPLFISVSVSAETSRYVSDELEITMRSGKGIQFDIRAMLLSGTKLEVLESETDGYSRVRTDKGQTGWVLSRYLSNSPSSKKRLASSQQRLVNLELTLEKYKKEVKVLSAQNKGFQKKNTNSSETSERFRKELAELKYTAANAIKLSTENQNLNSKLLNVDDRIQALVIENNELKDSDDRGWFLIGAVVLFSGLLLGLIVPRLRIQKKNTWSSF